MMGARGQGPVRSGQVRSGQGSGQGQDQGPGAIVQLLCCAREGDGTRGGRGHFHTTGVTDDDQCKIRHWVHLELIDEHSTPYGSSQRRRKAAPGYSTPPVQEIEREDE
jgi:hypothetical protein